MATNNMLRVAGIAGILSGLLMVGAYFTFSPDMKPTSLTPLVMGTWLICSAILAVGLYMLYRDSDMTLSIVALIASILGCILFIIVVLQGFDMNSALAPASDILLYVVGTVLFSWLALRTGKMPRVLAYVGVGAAVAGALMYIISWASGVRLQDGTSSMSITTIIYYLYFLLVLVWVIWTGYILAAGKAK